MTIGLIINLLIPIFAVLVCVLKYKKVNRLYGVKATNIVFLQFIILFVIILGLILLVLTEVFWHWSGMASLGLVFLVFIAPLLLLLGMFLLRKDRRKSEFHQSVWRTSCLCLVLLITIIIFVFLLLAPFSTYH